MRVIFEPPSVMSILNSFIEIFLWPNNHGHLLQKYDEEKLFIFFKSRSSHEKIEQHRDFHRERGDITEEGYR